MVRDIISALAPYATGDLDLAHTIRAGRGSDCKGL